MSVNQALWAAARDLAARARLTLATGAVVEPGHAEVISFSVDEGADSPLLPGAVLSARYMLTLANDGGQWRWGGSLRGERPLVGATVQLFLCAGGQEIPCGAFIVDSVSADEGSGVIRLSGSDSIAHELAAKFEDALVYPATLAQLWAHLLAQTPYAFSGDLPNGDMRIASAPNWKNASLRKAAGWMAQAAGCFVRVDRTGALELVSCTGGEETALTPDDYLTLSDGFDTFGPVHELTVTPVDDEEAAVTVSDGLGAAVSIEDNPLFRSWDDPEGKARAVLARLSGLALTKADFRWRGDPAVGVGDVLLLTDTAGSVLRCTVTRQTMKFDRGFSATVSCGIPESGSGGVARAITPEGGLNAGALVGAVDGGLLRAQSVTAKAIAANIISAGHLAADAVTAEKIAAGSVSAEKLASGAVTAEKLHADSVSGEVARFVSANIAAIEAKDIETSGLYASFAHLIELAAGSIAAGTVQADRLAAQLARVVSLQAATGEFDFASVRNLVSGAMSLEQSAADSIYVKNLAVTSANLLSATLGDLVLKGSDGGYYRVYVGSDGMIGAEAVAAAEGQRVVETDVNVADLNASSLKASSAVINRILTSALTAGQITAAEALIASATIPALYAASIRAIGDSLDLSANRSIRLMVGGKSGVFRSEAPPADADANDLWVQPSTGYTFQLADGGADIPAFYLDERGDLHYAYGDGQTVYALTLDEAGDLFIAEGAPFAVSISADGALLWWERVKDGDLKNVELRIQDEAIVGVVRSSAAYTGDLNALSSDISAAQKKAESAQSTADGAAATASKAQTAASDAQTTADGAASAASNAQATADGATSAASNAQATADGAASAASNAQSTADAAREAVDETQANLEQQIEVVYSEVEQTAEKFEVELGRKVGRDELTAYMRYADGVLELGRSGSRYTTRTSNSGFYVLQDGSEMASIEQNSVAAPVISARRMFTIGEHSMRLGASGHLILN